MGAIAENVSMSFVLPYAKCDLQLTTSEQGLLSTILYLGIVLSSHLWGFLADTWGRRKVIRLSAGGAFLFSALCSCMTTVSLLVTCRFFVGFLSVKRIATKLNNKTKEFLLLQCSRDSIFSIFLCQRIPCKRKSSTRCSVRINIYATVAFVFGINGISLHSNQY